LRGASAVANPTAQVARGFWMAVRRLVLHVGLPKTGTTTVQAWCSENRPWLANHGVSYPACSSDPKVQKHQFIVSALMTGALDPIREALSASDKGVVLLSAEGMTNHFCDFDPKALAEFRELIAPLTPDVLLVRRPTEQWLKSYYKQSLINPRNPPYYYGTSLAISEFSALDRVRRLLNVDKLAEDLSAAFGAKSITIADHDRDWVRRLFDLIGLTEAPTPEFPRMNESMPDRIVPLIQYLNCLTISNERRATWILSIGAGFDFRSNVVDLYPAEADDPEGLEPEELDGWTPTSDADAGVLQELQRFLERRGLRRCPRPLGSAPKCPSRAPNSG
jgi:hypothetical protein